MIPPPLTGMILKHFHIIIEGHYYGKKQLYNLNRILVLKKIQIKKTSEIKNIQEEGMNNI